MSNQAPSAYKLEQAFSALQSARARIADDGELIDDATGEILDISRIEGDAIALLHQTLRAAVEAEAMAKMVKERMDILQGRLDRYKARVDSLRGAAFAAMDVLEMARVELPDLTASMAKGSPSLVITNAAELPSAYLRVVPETRAPDKAAIAASLKAGIPVPGAELSNSLPKLTIRTR
jgi:hypothetical protein